jgi:hypothetical protein
MSFGKTIFIFLTLLAASSNAQIIDPYRRVNDPMAMASLTGDDIEPLKHRTRFGLYGDKDEFGHFILAADSGAGIITHIWGTASDIDSGTNMRLYIDGSIVISCTFRDFFMRVHGAFRPPLDTGLAGAFVNDVQMPYRKGFKITYQSYSSNVYYAISWRPVKDASKIKSFRLFPTPQEDMPQLVAEDRMLATGSPWDRSVQDSIHSMIALGPGTSFTVAELTGPAVIQELEFEPALKDPWKFYNLILRVYYDGNPYPAIEAPLYDFFLSATKYKDIHALSIKVKANGAMVSYFPMPFFKSCKITLENGDTSVADISARVAYIRNQVDRESQGYFHAAFSESKPTRMGIYHPVLHIRGKGKFVGLSHHIPHLFFPVDLEGDPVFIVDSNAENYLRYTGSEDYYNGGWWFVGTTYSRPFAGFPNWFDAFYRFHHLDAMDFKESFDFDMQHGVNNDVHENYRTVAYYYKRWTPFWVSRDTIKIGEPFRIQGSGYGANETITIRLAGELLDSSTADVTGNFSRQIVMPGRIDAGKYHFAVNGVEKPEWTFIIKAPVIRTIADHLVPELRERDTLLVTGAGFRIGEKVKISLDSIPLKGEFTVGSDFRFTGVVRMPYLPDREYHVVATGDRSGEIVAPYPIRITRLQNFEFEELLPPVAKTSETARRDNVSFFYYGTWSQQSFAYFEAAGRDSFVTFAIDVPRTDTFNVFLFATSGPRFGDYEYHIDGQKRGEFSGYSNEWYGPHRSDTLRAGVLYLEEGIHTVTFKCLGKHDSAELAWLGADNILLQPTQPLPIAPGTWTRTVDRTDVKQTGVLKLYPNPSSGIIKLSTSLTADDSDLISEPAILSVVDASGRVVFEQSIQVHDLPVSPVSLDLSQVANGNYLVTLELASAKRALTLSAHLNLLH